MITPLFVARPCNIFFKAAFENLILCKHTVSRNNHTFFVLVIYGAFDFLSAKQKSQRGFDIDTCTHFCLVLIRCINKGTKYKRDLISQTLMPTMMHMYLRIFNYTKSCVIPGTRCINNKQITESNITHHSVWKNTVWKLFEIYIDCFLIWQFCVLIVSISTGKIINVIKLPL